MSVLSRPTYKNPQDERGHRRHHARYQSTLFDMFELLPASSSAWIMSTYMNQGRPETRPPDAVCLRASLAVIEANISPLEYRKDMADDDYHFLESQWPILVACLVFGCSAASFLHRRQLRDPSQLYIFAVCVPVGAIIGQFMGATAEYIMLVHVSWAVCISMLASMMSLTIYG